MEMAMFSSFLLTMSLLTDAGKDLARRVHHRDCRRNHTLLYMCVITKNDDVDLQEWLVWQLAIVGAHHIVVYLNDPAADNSMKVLKVGRQTACTLL
jgi:hypothetical protein